MSLVTVDLNNINLDDDNFDEDELELLFLLDLLLGVKHKQHKACKKDRRIINTKVWDWFMTKYENSWNDKTWNLKTLPPPTTPL